ncbi:5-methylcytosine-specific restriction protein A [Paracandidimonas soli]|uniref:5-methylcytosine-specific restriction protein A n=2 Tax=Paracandidimonas soli TaxID=1917182 RepID=A0A4R3UYA3_9BURK|nr:5-methylcytosine-specific restriction protein A [Paracandidimonas soli]
MHAGCGTLVYDGSGYCVKHAGDAEKEWIKASDESGRGGRPWRRLRDQVLRRDGYLCQCEDCAKKPVPLVAHEVDHIDNTRGSDGRLSDDPDNLRAINRDCHRRKTQREAAAGRKGGVGRKFG